MYAPGNGLTTYKLINPKLNDFSHIPLDSVAIYEYKVGPTAKEMSWEMQQLVKAGLRLVEVNFLFFVNFSVLPIWGVAFGQ